MNHKERALYSELKRNGFMLVRQSRHQVWRNPDGKQIVVSSSPSDKHWAAQALRDLRRRMAGNAQR
jgi:predicted RNA binding protein YcfA (HicA-like mRNA interferase family)